MHEVTIITESLIELYDEGKYGFLYKIWYSFNTGEAPRCIPFNYGLPIDSHRKWDLLRITIPNTSVHIAEFGGMESSADTIIIAMEAVFKLLAQFSDALG